MKAAQVFSGLGWSAFGTVVNAGAQIAFLAALARLLDPEAFGLMAMAMIALRFGSFFAQFGSAQSLIQKPDLRPEDTTAAVLLGTGLGLALYAVLLLASPLFAAYFRAPQLSPVLAGLGWSLVVGTLAGLPVALLRRGARFKAAAGVETAAYVLGFGAVGIAAAAAGWGVWSLVLAALTQQVMTAVLGFLIARPAFGWPVRRQAFAHLWHFGSRYSLIGFLEFIWLIFESLVIGRFFGKADLGIFNRATTLTNLPVEQSVNAVTKVMLPALASLVADPRRLADAFCMLLLAVGIVSAALACGIAAAAGDTVSLLLGARWARMTPIVTVLAFGVPPMFMYVVCGVTLDSVAALGPKLRLQASLMGVKAALVGAAAAWGLTVVAAAVVASELVRLVFGLRLVARTLGMPMSACWTPLGAGVAVGAAVYVSVGGAGLISHAAGIPLAGRFAAETGAGALALALSLLLLAAALPAYPPLARFEAVRRWHGQLLAALRLAPVQR